MLIKNKKIILNIFCIFIFLFGIDVKSEEFDISAKEIIIDKEKETIIGKESVKAIDSAGKIITADKIVYNKEKEFILAEGNVEILDPEGNILKSNKATYDKLKELIITYDYTELSLSDGYNLKSKDFTKVVRSGVDKEELLAKHNHVLGLDNTYKLKNNFKFNNNKFKL